MMEAFKEWFLQQTPREQLFLGVGAIGVVIFMAYFVVWAPLVKNRDAQMQANKITVEQREEVRLLAGKILGQRQGGNNNYSQSLTQVVSTTMRNHGLAHEEFQPSGATDVRIRLKPAELNKVFAWLDEVENKKGIQIKDISVNTTDPVGFAAVNLSLHRE